MGALTRWTASMEIALTSLTARLLKEFGHSFSPLIKQRKTKISKHSVSYSETLCIFGTGNPPSFCFHRWGRRLSVSEAKEGKIAISDAQRYKYFRPPLPAPLQGTPRTLGFSPVNCHICKGPVESVLLPVNLTDRCGIR